MPLPDAEAIAPSDPKELINAYLLSKGMQPTNALMSQALMANAQNPGVIPGLRNMEPISSPGDPGMPPAPARGGGRGAAPPPAADPSARGSTNFPSNSQLAAANPPAGPDRSIGMRILDWLALPGAAGSKYLLGGPEKPAPPQLTGPEKPGGGDGGRLAPVPERPMLPGGGQPALPAPPPALPAPTPRSPLDAAIDRAVPESVPAEAGKGPPPSAPPVAEPKTPRGTVSVVDPKTIRPRTNLGLPTALEGKGAAQLAEYLRSIGRIHK